MFDDGKTTMIGLPYGEKNYDDMLSRFHLIKERNRRTDGQTDRQTDRCAISISRVSMLTCDKNTIDVVKYSLRVQNFSARWRTRRARDWIYTGFFHLSGIAHS